VTDVSGGCGQSFQVLIVSDIFKGLITIKRHRLINDYLKEEIKDLHAFSQKTLTRDEYENAK
ncbi:bola-like protein, partial [Wallemia mellicola CBS 633.66]